MTVTQPTFLVVGAARSGTTAVAEALRSHPDVFVTQPKEPHFFAFAGSRPTFSGPGDDQTINQISITDADRYADLYADAGGSVARGDASVSYLYYASKAAPRIRHVSADMRIVILLREPVSRAFSSFQYLRARGFEPVEDFVQAVSLEPERKELGWHHLWHYTSMSYYADAVATYLGTFPGNVGIWFYDDVVVAPERVFREVTEFVGASPGRLQGQDGKRVNASGAPRSAILQAGMHWVASRESTRTWVRSVVPFKVREAVRRANLRTAELPKDSWSSLHERFVDDLDLLEESIGRPLPPAWRRQPRGG